MASGAARKLHDANGLPVVIVARNGRAYWHEIWDGVPYIAKSITQTPINRLMNAPGARPYIASKTLKQWVWKPYKPTPAEIVFTPAERAFAEPYRGMVMIEPNVKAIGHDNKAWLTGRWLELAQRLHTQHKLVQCGPADSIGPWLMRATLAPTPTFRHAAAVLSVCRAFVGTEGGLMHAAAAVGTPSVILWSEFISPEITGYDSMTNLRHAGKPCGMRINCPSCRKSMEAITIDEVVNALERVLK
jgi:ADP-heptose:LPS heptosyltransferase